MIPAFRKLVCKPKLDDWSPLAKFYYADEALQSVTAELDSFDGRKDPDRCAQLIAQLRQCQDRVLQITDEMVQEIALVEPEVKATRDYRVKFPDDILHESLPGQLWFGAECLAAGSNIIDHEFESEALRPLAKAFSNRLEYLREVLKNQSLRNANIYTDKVKKALRDFDHVFAEFELNYVSAMVPVKTSKEYDIQLDVAVLFSEALARSLQKGYVLQDQIDDCDPSIMITLPRLAIVCGLLLYGEGPLNVEKRPEDLSEIFRPFQSLLVKIRDLLLTLSDAEVECLEKALCSQEEPAFEGSDVKLISEYRCGQRQYAQNIKQAHASSQTLPQLKDQKRGSSPVRDYSTVMLSNSIPPPAHLSTAESDDHNSDVLPSSTPEDADNSSGSEDTAPVRITVCKRGTGVTAASGESLPDVEIVYSDLPSMPVVSSTSGGPANTISTVNEGTQSGSSERRSNSHLRARFRSSADLIHRLFVCVSGVADQLQSNYPSDLRAILKMVLHPQDHLEVFEICGQAAQGGGREEETGIEVVETNASAAAAASTNVIWVPDEDCPSCTACRAPFTVIRRRHHCRNCGQIFCGRCSANALPLPDVGYPKPVRVCNQCFLYKLNPFTPVSSVSLPQFSMAS